MADEIEYKVTDNYLEHELHMNSPDPECSECYKRLDEHECINTLDKGSCSTCELFANIVIENVSEKTN